MFFSPMASKSFSAYANQCSTECLRGTICTAQKFSSMQPSSPWHSALWTPASLASSDSICSTQGELWALLGFPLLKSSLESLKAISWGNYRAHLIYFLSLRNHCSSFPDVQCLQSQRFMYFDCFVVVSVGMENLVSATLFWPRAKAEK